MHGQSKTKLNALYNTFRDDEPEKIYNYCSLKFWFGGTSQRTSEKLNIYVEIPRVLLSVNCNIKTTLPIENYLLRCLSYKINKLSKDNININKDLREKASFEAQSVNKTVLKRNGMIYNTDKDSFIIKINFNIPLVKAISVNAKNGFKAVKAILDLIETEIKNFDNAEC